MRGFERKLQVAYLVHLINGNSVMIRMAIRCCIFYCFVLYTCILPQCKARVRYRQRESKSFLRDVPELYLTQSLMMIPRNLPVKLRVSVKSYQLRLAFAFRQPFGRTNWASDGGERNSSSRRKSVSQILFHCE